MTATSRKIKVPIVEVEDTGERNEGQLTVRVYTRKKGWNWNRGYRDGRIPLPNRS